MEKMILFTFLSALVVAAMGDISETQVLQSNGLFSQKLYKILSEKSGNILFSPISAHAVLSMSYIGAEGPTKEAYVKALSLSDKESVANGYHQVSNKLNNSPNITLYWANKIYVSDDAKLKETFSNAIVKKFNSEVQSVNFKANTEAANTINKWVEQKTVDKIKNLISPNDIDDSTRLVLVNAIYFKGTWGEKFSKSDTRTEPFYINEKDKIDVQMMHITKDFRFKTDDKLKAKVLELPYSNSEFSMVIVLPDEKDGIKELENKLESVDLTKITDGMVSTKVNVALPKFKIEATVNLNDALSKMGLAQIFENSANFSGILEGESHLSVSKVIQKAFIEVNEEGTEAAAATALTFVLASSYHEIRPIQKFVVDHPFTYFVKFNSGILFQGTMRDIPKVK